MAIDEAKLNKFMERALLDIGAGTSAVLVLLGDKLGLYKAMANAGPMTPADLAAKTGYAERYLREWLNNQASGGYVTYDAATGRYTLPDEQALALADEGSPAFVAGAFQIISALFKSESKIAERFKSGRGLGWHEQDSNLFEGTERFFRPSYVGNLNSKWIPALDGMEARMKAGAKVADVGCGHGASTILMAREFPKSQFIGFDYHEASIQVARRRAEAAGLGNRVKFEVASSTDYPGEKYDLVAHFDCLHDMGDPVGAAKHVHKTLAADGIWMIVEPYAGDKPEENHNPLGRVYYAASTLVCVPASLYSNGPALGAQAGEMKLSEVVMAGGFTRLRRATQTPFNMVLEARK